MLNESTKQRISDWVEAHREDYLRDVARLVAIRSVKEDPAPGAPFGPGPKRALEEAKALCEEYGFATAVYGDCMLSADLGEQPAAVDVLAHLDVVDEGSLNGWETPPYEMTVKDDGCAYGRGTIDDKGPAVAALYAMLCVRELGLPVRHGARLLMGTDEECGSGDLPAYYRDHSPAPYTFSPDASFPVFNTEKGFYKPGFRCAFEKTEARPAVLSINGGHRINVLPAEAEALVAGLTEEEVRLAAGRLAPILGVSFETKETPEGVLLSVKGRDSHASLPEDGVNGITALLRMLVSLPLAPCGSTKALRALHELFPHGDSRGRALGIAMQDEISGELTVAFSLLTMTETELTGQFDGRVPLCANDENCRLAAEARFAAFGFAAEGGMLPPHHTPAETSFVQTLLESYEAFTGEKGACCAMGGGTYVHDIEGGVAFGPAMPDFEGNMHAQNEHMSIADMLTSVKIYAAALAEICAAD